jgi:DNA polymerase III delta prime subunit
MSISTIVIGNNKEGREEKILNLINDSKFSLKNNPDFLIIEKIKNKKSIGIEEVREIGKFLKILPISHTQKIVLIKEANVLTPEAQNSLLKILEEPPEYARIILEAESSEKFLTTILSRCQTITSDETLEKVDKTTDFLSMNLDQKFDWAEKTSKLEKDEIIEELNLILKEIKSTSNKPSKESTNLLLEVIDNLSKYNLNTRLALEYLSLNFEKKDNKI